MKNKTEKTPSSIQKRASRERFYTKLSQQRKILSKDTSDLRVLNTLKLGFSDEVEFELSETDRIALEKHNDFMLRESESKIKTVESDIRLSSAIARGKE